jgi:toxin CcdB
MNPVFKIKGQTLVLHPLDMVSVHSEQLGLCVGSLSDQGQVIADALDELLTRSWG